MVDLDKLQVMLDKAIEAETPESLNQWIEEHNPSVEQKRIETGHSFAI